MLSQTQLDQIRNRAGIHKDFGQPVPKDEEQRLYYGLMEILDFDCCYYGDAPTGVTEEDVKTYLLEHHKSITIGALPSYMGLFSGTFDFLKTQEP